MVDAGQKPEPVLNSHGVPGNRPTISGNQRGLWYFHQLSPDSVVYNVPFRIRLDGIVDGDVLARSLHAVVGRHEVLRTVYPVYKGAPLPVLLAKWSVELKQMDLRHLRAEEREPEAQRLMRQEAVRPFNLSRDVMLRALLIRMSDSQYWFLYNSHHIAFDGRSITVLQQDIAAFYNALVDGREPDLAPAKVQFSDLARWWQRQLDEQRTRQLADFWRQQLEGAPPLDLPSKRPRPPVFSTVGARYFFHLRPELVASMHRSFQDLGTTPFRGLLAAFVVFLHFYSGAADVSIGTPVVPRTELPLDDYIGFFVNTVVLRLRLSPQTTFRELAVEIANVVRAAIAHCDLPFEQIVDAVRPPRDPSRTHLFQVNFRAPKSPYPGMDLRGVNSQPAEYVDNGTSKFDLALEVESSAGQVCYFEYRKDLFDDATIAQMVKDYESVLDQLTSHPDSPLSALDDLHTIREVARRR
jgi:hypothetical protein